MPAQFAGCTGRAKGDPRPPGDRKTRAAVAVQVLLLMVVMLGMAALAVDVGAMYNTRAELMTAADAASLSGASFYTSDLKQAIGNGSFQGDPANTTLGEVFGRAEEIAYENYSFSHRLAITAEDVNAGWFDFNNPDNPLDTFRPATEFNAVEVTVRRSEGGPNGPLELLFAQIFGRSQTDVRASATAAFDDRFASFNPPQTSTPMTPFIIQEDIFEQLRVSGPDYYGYDPELESPTQFGDDIREIHLFPYKLSGGGSGAGSGNFGLVNVGIPNQGVPPLREQIINGITADQLEAEIGTSEMRFAAQDGSPTTYDITGSPGMKTALESAVEQRIGDVIGFFLYSTVSGQGANTVYTVTDIRFGRILDVHLTGPPSNRSIVIQPVVYAGDEIVVEAGAGSSGGLVGRLMLVR